MNVFLYLIVDLIKLLAFELSAPVASGNVESASGEAAEEVVSFKEI